MKKMRAYLCILSAGSLCGLMGLFTRGLIAGGLSSASLTLIRNAGGFVLLALVFLIVDRSVFRIAPRHLPYFFGTGICSFLLCNFCYLNSQQLNSMAVAAILLYTAPAFVIVLSFFLWKEKITRQKLIALALTFLGCCFVSGIWSGDLAVTPKGLILGIGSGFFYALYSIFGRYALAHYRPFTVTLYTFAFAGAGAFLTCFRPQELFSGLSAAGMPALALGLAAITTALPYLLYTKGLAEVEGGKASILASVEPVVAAFAGIIAFGEPMGPTVLIGLGCILVSVYILR